MENPDDKHKHHILPDKMGLRILLALLALTIITVVASRIDFGVFNFIIAMLIASIKALMVVLFFMGLKYDNNENRVIFASSFVFAALFLILTAADLFTRGDYKVHGPVYKEAAGGGPKLKNPWVGTDEIRAHGKEIFKANCVICHGDAGLGNGPASAALNPKPRNFTSGEGWKNGRLPSQVFGTLTTGLNSMPSFVSLSTDDRWSAAQYILSLGPKAPEDTPESLKKIGIDPTKAAVAEVQKRSLPIEFAIDRYIQIQAK